MGFQVNGSTIIDSSRNFATSSFPKTVNGQAIHGSGDLKYLRPGVSSNHVVGDWIIAGHTDAEHSPAAGFNSPFAYNKNTFQEGEILAGAGICVRHFDGFGYSFGEGLPFSRHYNYSAVMTSSTELTSINGTGSTITHGRQTYGFTIPGSWKVACAGSYYYSSAANDSYRYNMLMARVS